MELLDQIIGGQVDDQLDEIVDAVRQRREIVAKRAVSSVRPGMTVRLANRKSINPAYLRGIEVVVQKVNDKTVTCDVKDPDALPSRRYAHGIRVPHTMIDLS